MTRQTEKPAKPAKSALTLAVAKTIAGAAEQYAQEYGVHVAIALLDAAGELVYFQRMDMAPPTGGDLALAKAQYALTIYQPAPVPKCLSENPENLRIHRTAGRFFVVGFPEPQPLAGGCLLQVGRRKIGAIGVSGAIAELDSRIAVAGAAAWAKEKSAVSSIILTKSQAAP